jgi:hypothetical protein
MIERRYTQPFLFKDVRHVARLLRWKLRHSQSNRCAPLPESDRTLRDGSLGGRLPGTSCQATIMLSLRDEYILRASPRVETG